jgi:hypothetical protein
VPGGRQPIGAVNVGEPGPSVMSSQPGPVQPLNGSRARPINRRWRLAPSAGRKVLENASMRPFPRGWIPQGDPHRGVYGIIAACGADVVPAQLCGEVSLLDMLEGDRPQVQAAPGIHVAPVFPLANRPHEREDGSREKSRNDDQHPT